MEKSSALSGTGALPAAQSCPPRRSKAPVPRWFHTEGQSGQKEKGTRPDAFCQKYSSVVLQETAVRLGFAGSGSPVVSGQFQIERRQIQGGVQGIQMGALHAMGGVYARTDESSPAVHTGVPGSTDI